MPEPEKNLWKDKGLAFPEPPKILNEVDFAKAERDKSEKQVRRKEIQARVDLKTVLDSPEGRRTIANILFKCCVIQENGDIIESSFNPNSMTMAWTEGSRRLGFALMNDIRRARIDAMTQIQRERQSDYEAEERRNETEKA